MIPEKTGEYEVEGTIGGRKVDLSFDENSLVHIMSVLTDLYSDPEMAVLREYSTNALDAHVEAGETRPIEVTLPSSLAPFLRIKDYGVGLDADDIAEIYSKYGASTKRETNDQVGVLGLGCKSALTYTPQFSLVGIKDGMRATVSVSRDEDGAGSMTIIESVPTDAPNGVEVVVPTRTYNGFEGKATHLFRFWQPGTILVNGEQPKPIGGLTVIPNKMYVVEKGEYDGNYIVMGGVPYPVNIQADLLNSRYSLVTFVDIGAVNFTPSREALQYTRKTKECIAGIVEQFSEHIHAAIEQDVRNATTPLDAFKRLVHWNQAIPSKLHLNKPLRYRGREIPNAFKVNALVTDRNSWKLSAASRFSSLDAGLCLRSLWVHGFDQKFTAAHKKKLNKYAEEHQLDVMHYILATDQPDRFWFDPAYIIDWETIRAIKLPRTAAQQQRANSNRPTGSYDVHKNGKYELLQADKIQTAGRLYYVTSQMVDGRTRVPAAINLLTQHRPGCTVVEMTINRVNKFKRDFPMAVAAVDELIKIHNRIHGKIAQDELLAYDLQQGSYARYLSLLDPAKIDDPELVRYINLHRSKISDSIKKTAELHRLLRYRVKSKIGEKRTIEDPLSQYPLLTTYSYNTTQMLRHPDTYIYLNAAYAARKDGNNGN